MSTPPRTGPLTDLRVIELGQLIAGPFCGQIFADMGADVIKVEPPGQGDPLREWGREGFPLWWSVVARGKRLVIHHENCVHCKTCDVADPYAIITWTTPEGGDGPDYTNM